MIIAIIDDSKGILNFSYHLNSSYLKNLSYFY